MAWSPNGKWIAFHSHKDKSDDLYLVPSDAALPPWRITFLGRGFETGWPRWSPNGKSLVFGAESRRGRGGVTYGVDVDQQTGQVSGSEREIEIAGIDAEALHAEWLPNAKDIVVQGYQEPDRHLVIVVAAGGGPGRVVHSYQSPQRFSGISISPDGRWVVYPAPAGDGFLQLFRVSIGGGQPQQLTFDPSNKTQPAFSPDGRRIALTVWEYEVRFFLLPTTGRDER